MTDDESTCWASGAVFCVESPRVLALMKENLQPSKDPAAELSLLWGGRAGRLLPCCLIRRVFQKLASSQC